MNTNTIVCTAISAVVLAGCGGGQTFDERSAAADKLLDSWVEKYPNLTPAGDVDGGGISGTYKGIAGADVSDAGGTSEFIGDSTLTVNFVAESIEGKLDNWQREDGTKATGAIDVDISTFDAAQNGNPFEGTVSGLISFEGVSFVVDGGYFGEFYGPNGENIFSLMGGDLIASTSPDDDAEFFGGFAAEIQ